MDRELEKLIDQAGRGRVFARAHALGWSGSAPPKYVWEEIAMEILKESIECPSCGEKLLVGEDMLGVTYQCVNLSCLELFAEDELIEEA